jgi:mxaJ protein
MHQRDLLSYRLSHAGKNPMRFRSIAVLLAAASMAPSILGAPAATLRVCADPDYLPYSNRAGEGFENKIAEGVANALGQKLEYTWENTRGSGGFPEFLARSLDAKKCDVVMGIPYGSREALTTQPYYVSSYVFVFKKSKNYDIKSMDSQVLKRIKIGFESDTPVEGGLKMRGLILTAEAFDVGSNTGESPLSMLNALQQGQIDVLITWQPAISSFLGRFPGLEVVAVPNARTLGPPEQYSFPMSMGVRHGDEPLQRQLDGVIAARKREFGSILTRYGVKLLTSQ